MIHLDLDKINQNADIRAEVLAADMIERGMESERVVIIPNGGFSRNFRKDSLSIERKTTHITGEEYLQINVSRDGMYDSLPEGLFHHSYRKSAHQTLDDKIDEIKRHREEEQDIRRLFSALEKEFNSCKTLVELEERKSIFGLTEGFQSDLFLDVWPEIKGIDAAYHPFLFQILPLSHRFRGETAMAETLLGYVVNTPVHIVTIDQPRMSTYQHTQNRLTHTYLGVDMILGNTIPDYDTFYKINVGPVQRGLIHEYIHEGAKIKVIRFLLDYFLPFDSTHEINISIEKSEESLILSTLNHSSNLGFNSSL